MHDKFQSRRDRQYENTKLSFSPESDMLKFRTRLGEKLGKCMSEAEDKCFGHPCGSP